MPTEKFRRYFKFAFVRNPWERLVSEYEFILGRPEHGRHSRVKRLGHFNAFISMQIQRRDAYQLNMLCDRDGRMLMDFVGKLENLRAESNNDWHVVCERIGIDYQRPPHMNIMLRNQYQNYYDPHSMRLVAKHWSREIELFEYTFDND